MDLQIRQLEAKQRRFQELFGERYEQNVSLSRYTSARKHPILKITRMHKGLDIVVPTGTPVFATGDGVVKEAGRNAGYGLNIVIEHPKAGYQTRYAHLSKIPSGMRPGRRVARGEQIGLSGNTGLSKAPHLHYEVLDLDGRALNPIYFFAPSMTPQQYRKLLAESESVGTSLD